VPSNIKKHTKNELFVAAARTLVVLLEED